MALGAGDTVVWYGTTDDDWEVVTNWSPQEIPIDQVHVVVSEAAINPILTNLDRQGDTAGAGLDLRSLFLEPGCTVDIGASGNPLKCTVDHPTTGKASIVHYGEGSLYFSSETGTGGHITRHIVIRSPNMDNAAVITGDVDITGLMCAAGHTTVGTGFTATLGYVWLRRWSGAAVEPVLILDTHAAANVNSLWQRAGSVTVRRPITVVSLKGGLYYHESGVLSNLRMGAGQFELNTSYAVQAATLMGGLFDTTQTSHNKTIIDLWKFPEATLKSDDRLSITTEYDIFGEYVD